MRKITVLDTRTIVIGRMGENQAAQVVWPGLLKTWRGLYGEGTVQLTVKRPEDTAPYPAVCEISGDDVTWTVSAADTAQRGTGACELSYIVGDTVAKSQTWATLTLKSLSGDESGEPPEDPAKAWFTAIQSQIGDLNDLTTTAKANLVAAINEAAKTGSGSGSVEMRVADGYIQFSTDGETWENLIAVSDLKGEKGETGAAGKDGTNGTNGKDGADGTSVEISGISESTESGGSNVVTFSDGKTLTVKNGKDGAAGKGGAAGKDGTNGTNGKDGFSPVANVKETDSGVEITITDKSGTTTATVKNGKPGDTPVRGTDYWTAADKAEIVQDTLAALPTWTGGSY